MKKETIIYRGYKIHTYYDEDVEPPENDNVFVIYDHRSFCVRKEGFNPEEVFDRFVEGKKLYDNHYIFPLYAYIHGGVALSLSRDRYPFTCNWDTSFKGFVLVKRIKNWSWKEDHAYKIAESCVREWNQYLSGDVYGYYSDVGGCSGFYGDDGYNQMIKEAKFEIDSVIKNKVNKHLDKLKVYIRNKVPLTARKNNKYTTI